jgi:hypothetical protein
VHDNNNTKFDYVLDVAVAVASALGNDLNADRDRAGTYVAGCHRVSIEIRYRFVTFAVLACTVRISNTTISPAYHHHHHHHIPSDHII